MNSVYLLFQKTHVDDLFHLSGLYKNPLVAEAAFQKLYEFDKKLLGTHELKIDPAIFKNYFENTDSFKKAAEKGYTELNTYLEKPCASNSSLCELDALLNGIVNPDAVKCIKCGIYYNPQIEKAIVFAGGLLTKYGPLCRCP
jgi:hypothetical protein